MDVLAPLMETKSCTHCWEPVEAEVHFVGTRKLNFQVSCDACEEKRSVADEQERVVAAQKRQQDAFDRICPPLFRQSDIKRLPEAFVSACANWAHGPRGLGMVGPAGSGKTRCAWTLMRQQHFAGSSVHAITSIQLSAAAANQWHDDRHVKASAETTLSRCHSADILLIDDIGKQKFTDRAELELFHILDHRSSHNIPVIWTANADGRQLKSMLSPDRADPILRRLTEFADIIKL